MMTRRNMIVGAGILGGAGAGGYFAVRGPSYNDATNAIWVHRPQQVAGDLEYLVHHATLAANSHNTQPWLFSGTANQVTIRPDLSRTTPVVDPDNHHLFCSLGCAAENLVVVAEADGKSASVNFIPDGEGKLQIDLAPGSNRKSELFDAIVERQCTRSDYDGREVSNDTLTALENAAEVDGCSVMLITDPTKMRAVSDLIIAANTSQIDNMEFVEELKSWLRFNAGAAIEFGDGLYAECSGNPTLPTWLGKAMFSMVFSAKSENEKYAKQLASSSGLAIFVSDQNNKAHWVQAGRSYQRFALKATALGLKHAFLNQPVEVPQYRPELARLLNIGDKRPDLLVRFGYGEPMPRSMRRRVKAVIEQT